MPLLPSSSGSEQESKSLATDILRRIAMSSRRKTPESPADTDQGKKKRAVQRPGSATPSSARKRTSTRAMGNAAASAPDAPGQPHMPDHDAIESMVAEAAYYLAEKRHFAPGYEEADWLAARDQIVSQLRGATNPLGSNNPQTRLRETGGGPSKRAARVRQART
jgi:hypothetical protein